VQVSGKVKNYPALSLHGEIFNSYLQLSGIRFIVLKRGQTWMIRKKEMDQKSTKRQGTENQGAY
jgi:hypothetical protein